MRLLLVAGLVCAASVRPPSGEQAGVSPAASTQSPPGARVAPALSAAAADVLALERKIEDAIVRGDVAFVDGATSSDFSFVHGDGWTSGGSPLMTDDKAAFLKRVVAREYLVHDLDAVRVEMHGDIAITYGRYVSLFMPGNRDNAVPGRLNSIWFERVYAKRDGRWQFLSHRTVHGPTVSPAGIDPSAAPRTQSGTT
jgi:Domain of unknown function (DUF4440)